MQVDAVNLNNRACELLNSGEVEQAIRFAREAVRHRRAVEARPSKGSEKMRKINDALPGHNHLSGRIPILRMHHGDSGDRGSLCAYSKPGLSRTGSCRWR